MPFWSRANQRCNLFLWHTLTNVVTRVMVNITAAAIAATSPMESITAEATAGTKAMVAITVSVKTLKIHRHPANHSIQLRPYVATSQMGNTIVATTADTKVMAITIAVAIADTRLMGSTIAREAKSSGLQTERTYPRVPLGRPRFAWVPSLATLARRR
jgi:hypothetical protein